MRSYSDLKEDRYRNAATGNITLMNGVRDLLDGLIAHGVRLAIGSSGVLPNLQLTVRECGLEGQFAAIASVEDITKGKPDPQVFLVAARKCGIDPARAMVFEDAPVGIQAAKAAGMYAVGLTTSHPAQAMWNAGADEVVEDLRGYDVAASWNGSVDARLQAESIRSIIPAMIFSSEGPAFWPSSITS